MRIAPGFTRLPSAHIPPFPLCAFLTRARAPRTSPLCAPLRPDVPACAPSGNPLHLLLRTLSPTHRGFSPCAVSHTPSCLPRTLPLPLPYPTASLHFPLLPPFGVPRHPRFAPPFGVPRHPRFAPPFGAPRHPRFAPPFGAPRHPRFSPPFGAPLHFSSARPFRHTPIILFFSLTARPGTPFFPSFCRPAPRSPHDNLPLKLIKNCAFTVFFLYLSYK